MFVLGSEAVVVRRTRAMGRGVFARRAVEPGAVVGDYVGTVRRPPRRGEPQSHADQPYAMHRNARELIDPDPRAPGVHWINHGCEPNVAIALHRGHVLYVATRRVFAGEQLLVDYWLPPPDAGGAFHACACGAPHCRGVMELDARALAASDRYWWRAAGAAMARRVAPYGEPVPPLARYPARVRDVPEHPAWGSTARPALACDDRALPPRAALRRRVRETGRRLAFARLGLRVDAVLAGGELVARCLGARAR
jgi:hypothetical protein